REVEDAVLHRSQDARDAGEGQLVERLLVAVGLDDDFVGADAGDAVVETDPLARHPLREPPSDSFHFHLEIKPVLTLQGGFEWSTGYSVNPTPPEEAAAFLRQTEA